MKIVSKDNFDRDEDTERFVAEGIPTEEFAHVMCKALNDKYSGDYAPRYYKVVPDDYQLQVFEP